MTTSYNPNPIFLHCGILKRQADYCLFLWGEQKKHKKYLDIEVFNYPFLYSPFELKLMLFRKHEQSFFGTVLETSSCQIEVPLKERLFYSLIGNVPIYHASASNSTHTFPLQGVEIAINEINDYITTILSIAESEELKLADDFRFVQKLLTALLNQVIEQKFILHQKGYWTFSDFPFQAWQDSAPPSAFALFSSTFSLVSKKKELASLTEFSQQFLNDYLAIVFQTDSIVQKALNQLANQHEELANMPIASGQTKDLSFQSVTDYQQFLEKIGALTASPFKLGIRVEEAKDENDWQLVLFIHERSNEALTIDVTDLLKGNHPWRENPITFFNEALPKLKEKLTAFSSFSLIKPTMKITLDEAYQLVVNHSDIFQELQMTVLIPSWWQKTERQFVVNLKQKEIPEERSAGEPLLNWQAISEFDYSISIAGISLSEDEFQKFVQQKEPIIKLAGKWILWDRALARQIAGKIDDYKKKKKLTNIQAFQLPYHSEEHVQWQTSWNERIEVLLSNLSGISKQKEEIPLNFQGTLRSYQHDGFSWLLKMRQVGFGACLADDMGLGKTIQTIAYLLALKNRPSSNHAKTSLLICPTSLIGNWQRELELFAPSLAVYIHHGQKRENEVEKLNVHELDLIITSYSLAVRDASIWTSQEWSSLILDEAQHIKNVETKQRKGIKKITALHRIALTGTPVENHLKELWSIIDLLNDQLLGSYSHFLQTYCKEFDEKTKAKRLNQLHKLISPFILRRTKQDKEIQLQLPNKLEIIHRVSLTVEQASLYQAVVNELLTRVDHTSLQTRRTLILSSLTKLKQICNHPAHFLKVANSLENRSDKWEKLMELCAMIAENKEKALIFTQYKEMGVLLQRGLIQKFSAEVPFLHGSLQRQKREQFIEDFTSKDIPFFILSLKAGGVGLNLTAATHVIHYDRWWNPAVENQATDRAYRIGQTKEVTVHKLLTVGTIEEKIQQMLEKKQTLAEQILTVEVNKLSELTTEELADFLHISRTPL